MRLITTALVSATLAIAAPCATSAHAEPVGQRVRNLDYRIDMGVRNGSLTRAEASRLRTRLANVRRLEWRYRRNGLSTWERRDLNRRYDALSRAVRIQRHDRQTRWNHR